MIKLAVFDVDGTLVSKEHKAQDSTKEALKRLREKGIKIAIASGRPPFFVRLGLHDFVDFDYYICSNGTYVENTKREEFYRDTLSKEQVESLLQDFKKKDDAFLFQFDDAAYVYHGHTRMSAMISNWIGETAFLRNAVDDATRHLEGLPFAAVSHIKKENIEWFQKQYPSLTFDCFGPNYYDICKKESSKADGIRVVCDNMNIKMSEVIGFGDNYNDLKMIEQVGIGVAMQNAVQELKDRSDYVTSSVDEDGIYDACKHYGLL